MQESAITVLVVDDHTLTAQMTSLYLQQEGFLADYVDTLEDALKTIASKGSYDVVLLDFGMPSMGGMTGISKVVDANSDGAVVLFSGQAPTEGALRAIDLGTRGYIPKTLPLKSLSNAIRFVAMGEIYIPQSIAVAKPASRRKHNRELTETEQEIVKSIAQGKTNKDIARELGVTEDKVKMHVRSISAKMNVANRTQIAMSATAQGLI